MPDSDLSRARDAGGLTARFSQPGVSRQTATIFVAAAFAVTMSGTTLPTPLYGMYRHEFGFSILMSTVVFAVYALGVILSLVLLGRVSDTVGRRRVLLPGLAVAMFSAAMFLVANDVTLLLVGRVLSGISAGVFTGTATAALVDLAAPGDLGKATAIATGANMGGLGLGPLLSGCLARFAPAPLSLAFVVNIAMLAVAAIGIWLVPETVQSSGGFRLPRPRLHVPASVRETFRRAALVGFAGFGVLGLFTAIAPTFLHRLLGVSSPAVSGAVVCVVFVASAVGQVALVPWLGDRALATGCWVLIAGLVLIAVALSTASLAALVLAGVLAGLGHGASFRAGLTQINAQVPPANRAEVASTFFVVMYLGISVPVIGAGIGSAVLGLRAAGIGFCLVMVALALVALMLRDGHRPATTEGA